MDSSKFKLYSIGYVAENKKLGSRLILATIAEIHPSMNGELASNLTERTGTGVDQSGVEYSVKVSTDNAIEATWIGDSNRYSAPDVRRGERVFLWQYQDTDKYYWSSMGLDDHLRKKETIQYTLSSTADESKTEINPDTAYIIELSTHKKALTIRTNKADGEPYSYVIQLNTAEGAFEIQDDVGNWFSLDSAETNLQLKNASGSLVELNKSTINVKAPKEINLSAGSLIKATVGGSTITMTSGNITLKSPSIDMNN